MLPTAGLVSFDDADKIGWHMELRLGRSNRSSLYVSVSVEDAFRCPLYSRIGVLDVSSLFGAASLLTAWRSSARPGQVLGAAENAAGQDCGCRGRLQVPKSPYY